MVQPVIDFSENITESTQNFTGREWVFNAINTWLADSQGARCFLLSGMPGCGKTTIAARLAQFSQGDAPAPVGLRLLSSGFLSALHFCAAGNLFRNNPHGCTESLALQLAERFEVFKKALVEQRHIVIDIAQNVTNMTGGQLTAITINSLYISGLPPEDAFIRLVLEPLKLLFQEESNHQVVILIDALDEALGYSGEKNIVSLFADIDKLPAEELPEGVRFILTCRQDTRVVNEFLNAEKLVLSSSQFDQNNQDDIREYVQVRLVEDEKLAKRAAQVAPIHTIKLVETVPRKAEGNFQYVRFLLDAMANGQRSLTELDGLPEGLDGLYLDSLKRVVELGKRDWFTAYAPLMGVLSVAQESLTLTQLQAFTKQPKLAILEYRKNLQQFIKEVTSQDERKDQEKKYLLYHQSVTAFLHREMLLIKQSTVDNEFYLPEDEFHRNLVDRCENGNLSIIWEDAKENQVEQGRREYARQHYITHLYQAQEWDRLYAVLDAGDYGRRKVRTHSGMLAYARDLELGQQAVTREGMNYEARVALLPALWRYSLLRRSLGTQIDNYPDIAFNVMVALEQQQKALELVGLLTNPRRQVKLLLDIGVQVVGEGRKEDAWQVFLRASSVIRRGIGSDPAIVSSAVQMLTEVQLLEHRVPFLDELAEIAQLIRDDRQRMTALVAVAVALATEQEWKRAEAVTEAIPYSSQDSQTLCETVKTLVKARLWDSATSIALSISDEKQRNIAREAVVLGLSEAQEWDKAKALAQRVGKNFRFYALAAVARARAQAQPELAGELLAEILSLAYAEDFDDYRYDRYTLNPQDAALSVVVKDLTNVRLWDRAIRAAWSIVEGCEKFEALVGVAQALIAAGQQESAITLLTKVVKEVCNENQEYTFLRTKNRKDTVLGKVVEALIRVQLWDKAETVAHSIGEMGNKYDALIAIANALSTKQPERAQALLFEVETLASSDKGQRWQKASALADVAKTLAKSRLWDRAVTVAHSIDVSSMKDRAFSDIADVLVTVREWDRAVSIAQFIVDDNAQGRALNVVVKSMIESQEWDRAMSVAHSIKNNDQHGEALASVVQTLVALKDWKEALTVAQSIDDEKHKTAALTTMINALMTEQEWEQVKSMDRFFIRPDDSGDEELMQLADSTPLQTMAQLWDTIISLVQSLHEDRIKSETLATLFTTLKILGLWERALGIAHSLATKEDRADALLAIAVTMTGVALWDRAIVVAHDISEDSQKAEALATLAFSLAGRDPERAEELLSEALAVVSPIPNDEKLKIEALEDLAISLVKAQQWGRAVAVAQAIPGASERVKVFIDLLTNLAIAKPGEAPSFLVEAATYAILLDEHMEIDEIPHMKIVESPFVLDKEQANVFRAVVIAMRANVMESHIDSEKARRLITIARALSTAEQLEQSNSLWAEAESIIAPVQPHEPEIPHTRYGNPRNSESASGSLAFERLSREGFFPEDSSDSFLWLSVIFLAADQQWDQALALTWSINEPKWKVLALEMISKSLVRTGHLGRARLLLLEAEAVVNSFKEYRDNMFVRDLLLRYLVEAHLTAQDLENAEIVAGSISDVTAWIKDYALLRIVCALAKAQQWERAMAVIRRIKDEEWRDWARAFVIDTLVELGAGHFALTLIQKRWKHAPTRNDLLRLLRLARAIVPLRPEVGWAFFEAFD